jgi:replicative DNA helicase
MGKTALGLNIALNTIQASCSIFSLEMSKEQIMYRLCYETNINQMRLRSGKLYQNVALK